MKNLFIATIALLLGTAVAISQESEGAVLKFEEEVLDLGELYTDEVSQTKLDIQFTNEGDKPLVLSNVRGCCGTRIHEWPHEPVLPGEEGTIKIEYRIAPRAQKISRTVTVTSNAEKPNSVFRITGQVVER
ncbi:MAG: DUF1573 domain-containing protein [Bacteroidales bacterium]